MAQVLVDTNICLRLVDAAAATHLIARTALENLTESHDVHLAPQVLIEFWAVATRPLNANGLGFTVEQAEGEMSKLLVRFPLLRDTPRVFRSWRNVVTSLDIKGKRTHDARLAAVMEVHRVKYLLTFNGADFASFSHVTILDPAAVAAGSITI